jgi:ABC-type glycerol-3-phosphate transport system substrate-binding protein
MKHLKKWTVSKKEVHTASLAFLCTAILLCAGCSVKTEKHITVWTNIPEFASYIELYNSTHDDKKVLLVYKENPSKALTALNGEISPDVVIGPWLRTEKTSRRFRPLDTIFDREHISSSVFYSQLLSAGQVNRTQYLLPVSFNLPAVIFSTDNQELIEDNYMLSLEQIRKTGAAYNKQNENGLYTRIGFAPQSSSDFLYLAAKTKEVRFRESKNSFTWNTEKLADSITYLRKWTKDANTSSKIEQDFIYKYLYMPPYKQVTSGRTLFAYTTSDILFHLSPEQTAHIDYRWIYEDKKIPIEDSLIMLGIPQRAKHPALASDFIAWFLNADTQHAILEHKAKMNLDTDQFGIACGFSSLKEVNEHILPLYDTMLLSNTPPAEMLSVPEKLPVGWTDMKEQIVIPYLTEETANQGNKPAEPLGDRLTEWVKQNYN